MLANIIGLHIVLMMIIIDLSQEIPAIDVLTVLKSSLEHRRKHTLRQLQLYRGQVLFVH